MLGRVAVIRPQGQPLRRCRSSQGRDLSGQPREFKGQLFLVLSAAIYNGRLISLSGVPSSADRQPFSDNRPVESFTSDLSSGGVKLHDFAGAFALAIKVGFINNVQFTAPFIPCGVIELEL